MIQIRQVRWIEFVIFLNIFSKVLGNDENVFACETSIYNAADKRNDCTKCVIGYTLSNPRECIDNSVLECANLSEYSCRTTHCLHETRVQLNDTNDYQYSCVECIYPYELWNGYCQYFCDYDLSYKQHYYECKPVCTVARCQSCNDNSTTICNTCKLGYYLFENACLRICLTGYYGDDTKRACVKCNESCSNCTSSSECTACLNKYAITPYCECPESFPFVADAVCVANCPYQYKNTHTNVCEQLCDSELEYPILTSTGSLSYCTQVNASTDQYCYENLKSIKNNISFNLKSINTQEGGFIFETRFAQTPITCYRMELFGRMTQIPDSEYGYWKMDKKDLLFAVGLTDQECDSGNVCAVSLRVFWKEQIQLVIKVDLYQEERLAVVTKVSEYGGEAEIIDAQISNLIIYMDKLVDGVLVGQCLEGQRCSEKLIETPNSNGMTVSITQKAPDDLRNNIIDPLSIKLDYTDPSTKKAATQSFVYSSQRKANQGEITYTFQPNGAGYSGRLTVTSKINSPQISNRMLDELEIQNYKENIGITEDGIIERMIKYWKLSLLGLIVLFLSTRMIKQIRNRNCVANHI